MSEQLSNIIKFAAKVGAALMVLVVLFAPQGIITNTFNFMNYAEPIILQDYLATALTVASYSPGDFKIEFKTSGQPHEITFFENTIKIEPAQKELMKTEFATIVKTPVLIECELTDQVIKLKEGLIQKMEVRKISDDICQLEVSG